MKSIMFVCTGNICRSPMAHAYLQKKVLDLKKENEYIISSCGTHAINGECATDNSIKAIEKYNVDLTKHRATHIENTDITNYDLIFGLTDSHKRQIIESYPSIKNKVFTLKEYVSSEERYKDIDDPWGLSEEIYNATAKEIVEKINILLEII